MKNLLPLVIAALIVAGGWYWVLTSQTLPPTGALGLNSSSSAQGNLGGPDTGTPQTPQGDGTGVSENLILGINTTSSLGEYLTAFNGMTLYRYTKDASGTSHCTGSCATNWPPYIVSSTDRVNVSSVITGKVATTTRADGTIQITYNGSPLYFWKNDKQPNDINGQGVGSVWYVVKP